MLWANPWRMRSALDAVREPAVPVGSESPDGQRHPKDAEVVVVDLIAQPGVADLVEPLELIEANRIPIRH